MSRYDELLEATISSILDLSIEEGSLILEDVHLSSEIGGKGKIRLILHTNEGTKPHIHVLYKKIKSCVRLDKPLYFLHGEFRDKLSQKERKLLIKILNTKLEKVKHGIPSGLSNITGSSTVWEALSIYWNDYVDLKSKIIIDISDGIPSYMELEEE